MLIAPGATAFLLTRRFGFMLFVAVTLAVTSSFVGIYAAFFLDSAPAPTVVLVMALGFMLAFARAHRQARRA